jgi:hypothetical protein
MRLVQDGQMNLLVQIKRTHSLKVIIIVHINLDNNYIGVGKQLKHFKIRATIN